ncbi:uncharacterized protein [Diadema antillarum]|uniref:uncharacterized protein n=1 Tax=Diadema antillarum TaxID=105358 RepID=UPI003A880AF4
MNTICSFSRVLGLLACLMLVALVSASEHVATFSIKGVSGTVSFNEVANSMDVRISVGRLIGLVDGQEYEWSIRVLPMLYDRVDPCADEYVGDVFRNLSMSVGLLSNFSGAEFTTDTLSLAGGESISGRALVIETMDLTTRYCASILPVDEVTTAVAQFGTPFGGTVTFRQRTNAPEAGTSIYVDLFDVTEPIAAEEFGWHLSDNTGIDGDMTVEEWCNATVDAPYANIGDLTPKFGNVNVRTVGTRQRYFFVDTNITLTGGASILDKSLVFTVSTTALSGAGSKAACSPVRILRAKSVRADFNNNNVTGSVTFDQTSLWEPTRIVVELFNLRGLAGGYHVHKFPVPQKILISDFPGAADMVSGHFNPYNIDTTTDPDFPNGTNDEYEIGDISGKFGSLSGLNDFYANLTDWNMPLFGEHSIVGRSVIVHLANGARWVYGRIGYPRSVKTVTAIFTYPLVGQITFRQDADDPFSDTSVFLDLAHADGSDTTVEHDWHIHIAKIGDDHLDQTGRCSSTLGHFNPFDVKLTEEYATECSTEVTRRCEVGDFSKKYGRIIVPGSVRTQVGKYFFTDVQLPLSGVYSIDDRSIVVHRKDGLPDRLACGDTLQVFQTEVVANRWNETRVSGTITLTQNAEFDTVYIDSMLTGLGGLVGPWHVHVLPVPYDDADPCSGASVQGHYNPFNVMGSPPVGTLDYYELGDFSGKFDYWTGLQSVTSFHADDSATLIGPRSLTGRSIVIHLSANSERYVCSTLYNVLHEDDFRIEARVDIETDTFSGYVLLGQTHFRNGRMSDTTIEAFIATADPNVPDVFDWTVRAGDPLLGACDANDLIFNPNTVSTDGAYSTQCSMGSQLRCQVGDLTGKNGNYSSFYGRTLLTDINLPMTGAASVIGRPLFFQSTSTSAIGCGLVTPLPSTGVNTTLRFPQMIDFDAYAFKGEMARILTDVESWQFVIPHDPVLVENLDRCTDLYFWIIGENAADVKNELARKARADELGIYSTTDRCRGDGGGDNGGSGSASQIASLPYALVMCIAVMTSLWQRAVSS